MYRLLSITALVILLFFANTTIAADKVVVIPLGGSGGTGGVKVGNDNATCDDSKAGTIRWTGINFEGCNGTEWRVFSMASFGTVTSAGQVWMDRNLGASRVATKSNDYEAYGSFYQWGRLSDGHQIRTSPTWTGKSTTDVPNSGLFLLPSTSPFDWRNLQNNQLWQGVSGTNNPCPSGFRLPTEAEWEIERLSWGDNNNAAGAFASPLKLVAAGYRGYNFGNPHHPGTLGNYWSSTVKGTLSSNLYFSSTNSYVYGTDRANGFSVRCIKD